MNSVPDKRNVVLSFSGVSKSFGDTRVIDDFSLDIFDGEFITLLGSSGCGKTTLLRIAAGFEDPSGGEILVDGEPITKMPPDKRPSNMVFQNYALFPHMTVAENVAYGPRLHGLGKQEIEDKVRSALEMVDLDGRSELSVLSLSGGQRQRVAIARALVNEPRILLLDEPLGALDLKLRRHMQMELRKIQENIGTTFIYVTHDQEEALTMSHRIVVMEEGRAMQIGTPDEVYARPANTFVARFIGESNLLPGRVVDAIDGETYRVHMDGQEDSLRCGYFGRESMQIGEETQVCFRPEELRIEPADGHGLRGRVLSRTLNGPQARYEISLETGGSLQANTPRGEVYRTEQTVTVNVPADVGVIVRDEI